MKNNVFVLAVCLVGLAVQAWGQNGKIPWRNASFEGSPQASASPVGWFSKSPGSTPDILPGAWGIAFSAHDGLTCLGLVTREDGTVEDVGQTLTQTLKANVCYKFSIYLAHATQYVGYNHPIRLRVWGGNGQGSKEVLLASSPLIDHSGWKPYVLQFIPPREIRSLTFEAYYAPGVFFHYKGNILLDLCSPIEQCNRA
jgi:hypothetical protein